MKLSEQLSVIQNFIIFKNNKARLDLLSSDVGLKKTAEVLNDCNFYVNYKNKTYLEEVKNLYNKNVKNVKMYNNLDSDDFYWPGIMLQLIKESSTPYVMLITEDRMFTNTDRNHFRKLMKDFIDKKIKYMAIGKLFSYTSGSRYKDITKVPKIFSAYEDGGENLWLYKAKNSVNKSFSSDAVYERNLIIEKLENLIKNYNNKLSPRGYPQNMPHYFEDYYTDMYGNGIKNCGDMLCAVPKKEIIVSDETPGLKETFSDVRIRSY